MNLRLLLITSLFAPSLAAQTPPGEGLEPLPDVPPPPRIIKADDAAVSSEEGLEPAVTIKTEEGKKIEEYRIRGRLYMVKITPKNAPPYYLIDRDGDGLFESRTSDLIENRAVPKWVITEW